MSRVQGLMNLSDEVGARGDVEVADLERETIDHDPLETTGYEPFKTTGHESSETTGFEPSATTGYGPVTEAQPVGVGEGGRAVCICEVVDLIRGNVQGYLAHKKTPNPLGSSRTPGIGLRWGPKGVLFLMSEVTL